MASIANEFEHQIVKEHLALFPDIQTCWLGFTKNKTGTFEWVDGTKNVHLTWADGEPDYANGNEECAELHVATFKAVDKRCQDKSFTLCKRLY